MTTDTKRYLDGRFRSAGIEAKTMIDAGDVLAAQHRLGMMHGIDMALQAAFGFCKTRDKMLRVVADFISDCIDAEDKK